MMGIFSEYIRNQSKSFRSGHPLWSFSGIGKNVEKNFKKNIIFSIRRWFSFFENLLKFNTFFLSLGKPHTSIGMLHYIENLVGVPYRYNKEFYVNVKHKNKITKQYCLLGVRFKSKKYDF